MRSKPTLRTLALAAVLAGSLTTAPPAQAAGGRSIRPAEAVSEWLRGLLSWGGLSWLAGEAGSIVDPDGGRSSATGEAGHMVDPDGAPAADTGEAGSWVDPDG